MVEPIGNDANEISLIVPPQSQTRPGVVATTQTVASIDGILSSQNHIDHEVASPEYSPVKKRLYSTPSVSRTEDAAKRNVIISTEVENIKTEPFEGKIDRFLKFNLIFNV